MLKVSFQTFFVNYKSHAKNLKFPLRSKKRQSDANQIIKKDNIPFLCPNEIPRAGIKPVNNWTS